MLTINNANLIPIGCSCINQFQLNTLNSTYPKFCTQKGSLFDWTITSPKSTIEVFDSVLDGSIYKKFISRENYILDSGHLRNILFESLYFWHEPSREIIANDDMFKKFQAKVTHLIDNLITVDKSKKNITLWSNLQPNLQSAIQKNSVKAGWEAFFLHENHYNNIKYLAKKIFGKEISCTFIGREEDLFVNASQQEDIFIFDLDRSDDPKGPTKLYEPIFKKIINSYS